MSTSLGPPFTLNYNDKKASYLDVDFVTRSPHPTLMAMQWGDYHESYVSQSWWMTIISNRHWFRQWLEAKGNKSSHESLLTNMISTIKRQWMNTGKRNQFQFQQTHYSDVLMSAMVSQFNGAFIICLTVCWGADQRKCQSSTSLASVRGSVGDRWLP